jgi:hypothetical protein
MQNFLSIKKKTTKSTSDILFAPFYSIMKMYVKMDLGVQYDDVVNGKELTAQELETIFEFRNNCYENRSPHLLAESSAEVKKEKIYDEYAYHAIARDNKGEIVAVSRFLPYPFEMCQVGLPSDLKLSQFTNYLEISRLVTSRPGKGIGKRLLIHAGVWAIEDTIYDGFLAIAREKNLKLFSYFGLSKLASFQLEKRPGADYSLIKADFRLITKSTMKFFTFKNNTFVKSRLVKSITSVLRSL